MNKQQEKVLVAALAGLVIVATAAFAVSPAVAAGYDVDARAQVTGVADWDMLNVRKWPAAHSQKVGELAADDFVWVGRCRIFESTSDWCLVERGDDYGWVNARYLEIEDFDDDY